MSEPTSPSHDDPSPSGAPQSGSSDAHPPTGDAEKRERVTQAIMFTDIEGSVNLAGTLGPDRYAEVLTRHGELFYEALAEVQPAKTENTGDGFMVRFNRADEAVGVALRFQWLLHREAWGIAHPPRVRIGIHQGEILLIPTLREMTATIGMALNLASRVQNLADGGQILLTRPVFDEARQSIKAIPDVPAEEQAALGWEAHGAYLLKGIEGSVEVCEVGERGRAPFRRPHNNTDAERWVSAEEEATLGWRPAPEMEIPRRSGWWLVRPLGQGGFGEVWLAKNRATHEQRVFKFCFDVVRLRSFKREVMFFRLLRQAIGARRDIAMLHEVQLEAAPFFLESEYCGGGTLDEWLEQKLRTNPVPLGQRLAIVAGIARALAAAHSVGVIHKDVKPSNVFIEELRDGTVQPRLADFGIGELANRAALDELDANVTGMTMTADSSRTGTRMYSAPEYMVGAPPSIVGDIYSLGVLLYQVVIADFHRPLGDGWRRDVPDELLAEDIAACVAAVPERRLASAVLLAERLESLEQRRTERAAEEAAERQKRESQAKALAEQKKRRLVAAFGGIIIAALIVVAVIAQQSRNAAVAHAKTLAEQRLREQDQRYREDMIAVSSNLDNWRGETARPRVERQRPAPGEPDRRGWEWYLADSALNPEHIIRHVSADPLRALAISPDEKSAAVAGDDGEISIWSCDTVEKMESWHVGPVRSLAWKGEVLAIGLANGEVILWDATAKRERKCWRAHDGAVTAMAWNPGQDELTTGGEEGLIAWWQSDGTPSLQRQKQGPVLALDWQQDGSQLAAVLGSPTRLIAATPEAFEHEYPMGMPDSPLAWRPGANQVAVAMKGKAMCAFDPYLTDQFFTLDRHFSPGASAVAWAPDGLRIAIGGIDGKIIVVNTRPPNEIRPALYGHNHRVTALRWLRHERLLSIGDDGTLRMWDDLQRPAHFWSQHFDAPLAAAEWHPHEPRLAVLVTGDEVQVLEPGHAVTWARPMPPPARGQMTYTGGRLAWSPDGNWLAAACPGRGVVAWRMGGDERFQPGGLNDASEVRWLDDGSALLVRTGDGWFRTTLAGGSPVRVADAHTVWMGEVAGGFLGKVTSDAGALHYTAAKANAAPSIDVELPKELGTMQTCALSADHGQLAVGGETGALVWLDTRTGRLTRPARMHSSAIQAMSWYPDGSRLLTASSDGTCRLIDIAHVAETWAVEYQIDPEIVGAGWSADRRSLLLASGPGGEIKFYEILQSGSHAAAAQAADLLAAVDRQPDEESAWSALVDALRASKDEHAPVLLAAAELGRQARFEPPVHTRLAELSPATAWEGVALPRVVQIAQACALERWDEVVALSTGGSEAATSWLAFAKAGALAHLGRKKEAEAANLEAWKAVRRSQGMLDAVPDLLLSGNGDSSVDLSGCATARREDDWVFEEATGNENNHLKNLPALLDPQPDGVTFRCGDFVLLGGKTLRLTTGRMLPRSTRWIPLNAPGQRIACVVAAGNVLKPALCEGTCIGSLLLLRKDGGAVRIPLVFGQNIWGWWVPNDPTSSIAPQSAIAWSGTNPRANHFKFSLALYRLNWTAEPGDSPVVALSIVSTMRQPAPLLMSLDAQP